MENHTLLAVEDFSIAFRQKGELQLAVEQVSFEVKRGECVGIVGESGSGKSITSLSIMRLLDGQAFYPSGKIWLHSHEEDAVNLLEIPEKKLSTIRGRKIAMIFQEPMTSLNPVIKCGKQVAESILLHQKVNKKKAREQVLQWFREVKLPRVEQIYNSYPHELSGGQKQRVMIAMAMCCNPQLLIADEPTTALDVTVQNEILKLIRELQEKHQMSVIFITHDLGVVAEIADRVVVMKQGKIVETGEVEKIFTAAGQAYTKGLIACRPPLDYRLKKLPTVLDFTAGNTSLTLEKISEKERKEHLSRLQDQAVILKVKKLSAHFPISSGILRRTIGHVKAVNEVTFEIRKGETLGLVGESGCGKTTLSRTLLKLNPVTSGQIVYKGRSIQDLGENEFRPLRKEMQIIFQDPYSSLNPRQPIGKAIEEPMQVHGIGDSSAERKSIAIELMEKVGLHANHYHRYPHQFSGGQRQRVCIARALSVRPQFVICDESVSALDVSVQAQVLNLLNQLKEEFGLTYIFISHDLSVVKYMSDRIMVMKDGEIEEIGEADELYFNPKKDYTKTLIRAIPKIKYPIAI
jgi:peptide/nickel transport system ATP-binding protein